MGANSIAVSGRDCPHGGWRVLDNDGVIWLVAADQDAYEIRVGCPECKAYAVGRIPGEKAHKLRFPRPQ